jgi:hypothetical protein
MMTPNLKTDFVMMYCVIRAIAYLRLVKYEYGEMAELL